MDLLSMGGFSFRSSAESDGGLSSVSDGPPADLNGPPLRPGSPPVSLVDDNSAEGVGEAKPDVDVCVSESAGDASSSKQAEAPPRVVPVTFLTNEDPSAGDALPLTWGSPSPVRSPRRSLLRQERAGRPAKQKRRGTSLEDTGEAKLPGSKSVPIYGQ